MRLCYFNLRYLYKHTNTCIVCGITGYVSIDCIVFCCLLPVVVVVVVVVEV